MGCFDLYCKICGGPFVSFEGWDLNDMDDIDTSWLVDAVIEYYETGTKINVCSYDDYGCFEDKNGVVYDVADDEDEGKVGLYHKLCENRTLTDDAYTIVSEYQEQHFDIERMISDGNQEFLHKPS